MTTVSPPRPDGPAPPPSSRPWRRPLDPESTEARAARLRLRRRMALWSVPVVVLLALVATKLITTVALGEQALAAYAVGNVTGTQDAAARLQFLNVVEAHKAPFARGDALVLAGDYEGARAAFDEALALAPKDSRDACQIRVNLVLSLEKLGDAAKAAGRAAAAKASYDRVEALVAQAPPGCFQGDAQDEEGRQLRDAQQRVQDQALADRQQDQQQQGQSDQQGQPTEDKQQQLDDKTKDNLEQRQQGGQPQGSSGRPQVDKPW